MKKYLFFALTLVFFACGQEDDDDLQSSRRTSADALAEQNFIEDDAYRIDISIDCEKCAEGEQSQEYSLFLEDVSVFDHATLKQIHYYDYDPNYCEAHTEPAYVEVTVTGNDNSSEVYYILETACAFTLKEGRFITKEDYARLAGIAYSGN
ncbi:MAG: hypothetical protein AB8G05_08815 [Oligoflexales bacterium]